MAEIDTFKASFILEALEWKKSQLKGKRSRAILEGDDETVYFLGIDGDLNLVTNFADGLRSALGVSNSTIDKIVNEYTSSNLVSAPHQSMKRMGGLLR